MIAAVLVASLLGSVHCMAMCGPLVGLHGGVRTARLALVHSLGRLTTYATLGVLGGLIGRAVDLAGDLAVVQRTATIVAGLVIVAWGGYQLAIALGLRASSGGTPRGQAFSKGLVKIRTQRPSLRVWLVGVLTGLLPCGWLWAFVIAAAGTGHPVDGALVMLAFWLGTVPAMLGVLTIGGPVIAWLRQRVPVVTALALIILGLGTLAIRWHDAGTQQVTHPNCHHAEHG
ncbi:MAG TPA: sulfite exporter TauE/SafE family protein [Kofleriaceae bacterium]|nr:sulfite exporter TauE/SafE family protein [Kofleriaceae bacterium]